MVASNWPKGGSELRPWTPSADLTGGARKRYSRSYRAAVVERIGTGTPELPAAVSAVVAEASAEIVRFDAELARDAQLYSPALIAVEAMASSRIEGIVASAADVALARLHRSTTGAGSEIAGNVLAIAAALETSEQLTADAVLAIHAAVLGDVRPDIACKWREEQVWIGGTSLGPHNATFIPPHQDHVPALIDDLVAFTRRVDIPLLAQVAIAHAQFETIHPFPDGNGRTGRALIHSMLRGHDLQQNVTVPVSAGLRAETNTYFDALTAYRHGDPSPIVKRLADASFEATTNGRQLVAALRGIRTGWDDMIKARQRASAWRVADLLLRQPVVDAVVVGVQLGIAPQNAQRAIAPLAEAGILTELTGLKRNRMWQAREVLTALDDFAARAGRRG